MNRRQTVPPDGVDAKHVAEQLSNVSELVVLVAVDSVVILDKRLFKQVAPESVDFCESLANQAKELGVCLFLRATLDDHGRQLRLLTRR